MKSLTIALSLLVASIALTSTSANAQSWGGFGTSRCGGYPGLGPTSGWSNGYANYGTAPRTPCAPTNGGYPRSGHYDVHYDRTPGGIVPHTKLHHGNHVNGIGGRW